MGFSRVNQTRMQAKAIAQRWPMTEQKLAETLGELRTVVQDSNASQRERLSAIRGLHAADCQGHAIGIELADFAVELGADLATINKRLRSRAARKSR